MDRYSVSKFDEKTFVVCDSETNTRACICHNSPLDNTNAELRAFAIAAMLNAPRDEERLLYYDGSCPNCEGSTKLVESHRTSEVRQCEDCRHIFTLKLYVQG